MLNSDRLKIARKACGLTQQQVSELLGVDRSTYAYYELGVSSPSLDRAMKLASMFHVEIDWLFRDDESEEKKTDKWSAPETVLEALAQIKEMKITELSKDERALVSLYRLASKDGHQDDLFKALYQIAGITDEEDEE